MVVLILITNFMINDFIITIIPCYNHGIYLDNTLQSLYNQTFKKIKIIIVDDGSDDLYTLSVYDRLKSNSNITIIYKTNSGPAAARNLGFNHLISSFILIIDADDMIESTFVEKALKVMEMNPNVGAVSAWALCFGFEDYVWYPQGGTLKDFLLSTTCPSCALIRREAWLSAEGFDESFIIGYEDWDFWIRLTKKGWIVYIINEILYYYLQKAKSRVTETFSRHAEIYKVIVEKHPDVFQQ